MIIKMKLINYLKTRNSCPPMAQRISKKAKKKYKISSQFSFLEQKYETSKQYFYARMTMR